MARLSQAQLNQLAKSFEDRTPEELLRWAKVTFGDRIGGLSAMQEAGSVVCHMISHLQLDIPVVFVDTGVSFPETLETRDRIAQEYGLEIRTLLPELTMAEQTEKYGVLYLSVEGQKECCHMRKVEPLLRIKGQYDALIGSLRRADGGKRFKAPILGIDTETNTVRVNPLANFTDEQMLAYIEEHRVIVNPLHSQGYSTISCNRCTTPVMPGEPKRAGRWRHLGPWSSYCGINPSDVDDGDSASIELPQDLVDRLLGQKTDYVI
ncbi:phosphoadenylyl-sulfate reductase [Planctomicrobium sp. SH664]|uniref:phosphoadenylyl-sulfate reductase n=1 Tax=Planctomicrobium sp. SH664 TaxID=3448125 RepID=UPI003F5BAAE9